MKTKTELYLIETKLNDSAKAAMRQIDLEDYPARFFNLGLPIVKVGIYIDPETCTVSELVVWQAD